MADQASPAIATTSARPKPRTALARLPVTRKSDLSALQKAQRPFAGMTAVAVFQLARVFASPGPIYDPQADKRDYWGIARALYAHGFREGELVHNTFSYHFTPAGFMYDLGAQALGCPVFPAGVGQTELQVQTIADEWTFARNPKSRDPNWKLVATNQLS